MFRFHCSLLGALFTRKIIHLVVNVGFGFIESKPLGTSVVSKAPPESSRRQNLKVSRFPNVK